MLLTAKPAILGFTYIDDDSLTQMERSTFQSLPKELFYKTDDEVRQGIFKELNGLKEPILGNFIAIEFMKGKTL